MSISCCSGCTKRRVYPELHKSCRSFCKIYKDEFAAHEKARILHDKEHKEHVALVDVFYEKKRVRKSWYSGKCR